MVNGWLFEGDPLEKPVVYVSPRIFDGFDFLPSLRSETVETHVASLV